MSLRPRTQTELHEIVREGVREVVRMTRSRIEGALETLSAHPYDSEPEIGESFVDSCANSLAAQIERMLETEKGL